MAAPSLDGLTDRARAVLKLAAEEAAALGHPYIGTEHVLLGLIREPDGIAGRALQRRHVSLSATRREIEDALDAVRRNPVPEPGLDQCTDRTLLLVKHARAQAARLKAVGVNTEHLLLGMLAMAEPSVSVAVLERMDQSREQLLNDTLGEISRD